MDLLIWWIFRIKNDTCRSCLQNAVGARPGSGRERREVRARAHGELADVPGCNLVPLYGRPVLGCTDAADHETRELLQQLSRIYFRLARRWHQRIFSVDLHGQCEEHRVRGWRLRETRLHNSAAIEPTFGSRAIKPFSQFSQNFTMFLENPLEILQYLRASEKFVFFLAIRDHRRLQTNFSEITTGIRDSHI